MIHISPSMLAADYGHLADSIAMIEEAGADYVHFDIMDGLFVPNLSFGAGIVKALRPVSGLFFDVHLMICDPIRYLDDFAAAGADLITIHYEATEDPLTTLRAIREKGVKAGISIRPATPVSVLEPLLKESYEDTPLVDLVLIMTVNPGFGAQALIEDCIPKVGETRALCASLGLDEMLVEVDGGVKPNNVDKLLAQGADVIVAGSAVFGAADPKAVITALKGE